MRPALLIAFALLAQTPPAKPIIETPDGAKLASYWFDAGKGAPGVLFLPMCSEGAFDGWLPVARRLHATGISSLIASYRGEPGNTNGTGGNELRWSGSDANVAFRFLQERTGTSAPAAVAGSSCGVNLAFKTAIANPANVRAVVALSGPHAPDQLEYVRKTATLAVFSGASAGEPPSPDWARALNAASANPASRVQILEPRAHGTDLFKTVPGLAVEIADWLAAQLKR